MAEKKWLITLKLSAFYLMIFSGLSAIGGFISDYLYLANKFEIAVKANIFTFFVSGISWLIFKFLLNNFHRYGTIRKDDGGNDGGNGSDGGPPEDPVPPPPDPQSNKDLIEELIRCSRKIKKKDPVLL